MDPLSITAGSLALAATVRQLADYAKTVRLAPKEADKLIRELDSLRILLDELAATERGTAAAQAETLRLLCQPDGPLDQLDAVVQALRATLARVAAGSVAARLTWGLHKDEVKAALAAVERLKTVLIFALVNDTARIGQAVRQDGMEIKAYLNELLEAQVGMAEALQQVGEDVRLLRRDTLVEQAAAEAKLMAAWLCPDAYAASQQAQLQEKLREKAPGTGAWVLQHAAFHAWLAADAGPNDRRVLYCPGIPAAGKSVLSAAVVQHLQAAAEHHVVYHFCNYASDAQTVESMLGFLCRQLLVQAGTAPAGLRAAYNRHSTQDAGPAAADLAEFLQSLAAASPSTVIVVDALDECDEDVRLEFAGHVLPQLHGPAWRCMVTARPLDDIDKALGPHRLTLEIGATSEDIALLIQSRLGEPGLLKQVVGTDKAFRAEIVDTIIAKSKSMFLLARLHLDAIARKPLKSRIRQCLAELAETIPSTYVQALARIDPDARELVQRILAWVCFAKSPLEASHIRYAIAIETGSAVVDQDDLLDPELVVRLCQGLVFIEPTTNVVRLVHETLSTFLSETPQAWFPHVHQYLADSCLALLMSKAIVDYETSSNDGPKFKDFWASQPPMLWYVLCYFPDHVKRAESEQTSSQLQALFDSDYYFGRLRRLFARAGHGRGWVSRSSTGLPGLVACYGRLHLACGLGITSLVQYYIQSGRDVDKPASAVRRRAGGVEEHITPLCLATRQDKAEIVRLLLDAGADINAPSFVFAQQISGPYGKVRTDLRADLFSPLATAARMRALAALKVLLDRGASMQPVGLAPGTKVPQGLNPGQHRLVHHALSSSSSVLGLLVQAGFKICSGSTRALHMLTAHDTNEPGSRNSTSLLFVKMNMVLQAGVDIDARDDAGRTALMVATQGSRLNAVRWLLENGADYSARDQFGKTALDWSIESLQALASGADSPQPTSRQSRNTADGTPRTRGRKYYSKQRTIVRLLQEASGVEVVDPLVKAGVKLDRVDSGDSFDEDNMQPLASLASLDGGLEMSLCCEEEEETQVGELAGRSIIEQT